jgi:hypothetical protein
MEQTVEERISTLHYCIKELFPDAVSVNIHVTSEGISVFPEFRTNISGYTMKNISGKWIKKAITE